MIGSVGGTPPLSYNQLAVTPQKRYAGRYSAFNTTVASPRFGASQSGGGIGAWFRKVMGGWFKDENVQTLGRWLDRNKLFIEQGDCRVYSKKTGETRYDTKTYHIELGGEEYYIERTEDAKVDWQIKYSIINVERKPDFTSGRKKGELAEEPLGILEYVMQRSCSNGKNGNFVTFKHSGYACNIEQSQNPALIEKTEQFLEALSKILDDAPGKK